MDVAFSYQRSAAEFEEVKKICDRAGTRCLFVPLDVTQPAQITAAVQQVTDTFGRLDIFIHMASLFVRRPLLEISKQHFTKELDVHAVSALLLAQAVVPLMRTHQWGRIIHVTDWTVDAGRPGYTADGYLPYYVGKGALHYLTQALAVELAKDNITVNEIAPGPMLPPRDMPPEEIERIAKYTPQGRWGSAEDIAQAMLYFLQDDSFVTGETLRINGGRHLT